MLLLVAISIIIFVGTNILPGDVAESILGQSATPEALANLREELGLNTPPLQRYLSWFGGVLTGDLGSSLATGQDIATNLGKRLGNTLFLAMWAAIVAVPLSVFLGLMAVQYRNGFIDKMISAITLTTISLPEIFIGYLLIYFFAVKLDWFTNLSTVYVGMPFAERMAAIALPAATLTLVVLAHMMRMTRAAILNVMQSPYIETAELKGLSPFAVFSDMRFLMRLHRLLRLLCSTWPT